jgi:hypothetical protein
MTKPTKYVYVLRTCNKDLSSHKGFAWKPKGEVKAPDWDAKPECGHGLHGLLWGDGNAGLLDWSPGAAWLVCKVAAKDIVDIDGKVKFPKCKVVFCGDRKGATDYIIACGADPSKVVGAFLTGGDGATLTGGDGATLTGGDGATLTGGDWATLTGGYRATLTGGYGATLTGGDWATLTGGYGATLTGGDWATLNWKVWDGKYYRMHTAYVGEKGIKKDTPYTFDREKIVEVKK